MFPESVTSKYIEGNSEEFSALIESYILELVSNLLRIRSQSLLIRKSIVAVVADSSTTDSLVTTREVCRTLRNFSVPIPDLSSLTRVPDTVTASVPPTPSAAVVLEKPIRKRGRPKRDSVDTI